MKIYKYLLSTMILAGGLASCEDKDEFENFADSATPPSNLELAYSQSNDNTGLVTLTPLGEGVTEYVIDFGDGSMETAEVPALSSINHVYSEGDFEVGVTGKNVAGKTSTTNIPITVTYLDPENLVFSAVPDGGVSNGVIVTASADLSDVYSVDFGESVDQEEILVSNGESVKYAYATQGTYLITVTAKVSGAPTRELTGEPVEVATVEFNHPEVSAPLPGWPSADVINVFSDAYAVDMPEVNYNPDWGQQWQGSGFGMYMFSEDDQMLRYTNLSYQGIDFGTSVDLTSKTYVYMDVWSDGVETLEVSLINGVDGGSDERLVSVSLVANQWNVVEIPIQSYIDQGLSVDSVFQIKLVGLPWAQGNIFVDNILFY